MYHFIYVSINGVKIAMHRLCDELEKLWLLAKALALLEQTLIQDHTNPGFISHPLPTNSQHIEIVNQISRKYRIIISFIWSTIMLTADGYMVYSNSLAAEIMHMHRGRCTFSFFLTITILQSIRALDHLMSRLPR